MQPTPQRLLATTARSTFESLALLYAEPAVRPSGVVHASGATDRLGAGAVTARVAFTGVVHGAPAVGALGVAVSAEVAAALAENMLGVTTVAPEACRDAVGEFANVVCGHVLSAAGGPEAVFRLSAPEAGGAVDGAWHACLDVECGQACVTLDVSPVLFAAPATDGVT